MNNLYTIGYSSFTRESFINLLHINKIDVVVDVRSTPYSRYRPEFNKKEMEQVLPGKQITYVFLGNLCGGRFEDPGCYRNGKADYELIAQHPLFLHGLERIKKGLKTSRIVLMCAEKDPITCHRMILIAKNLKSSCVRIINILESGKLESLEESEKRLVASLGLDQPQLFIENEDLTAEAYRQQGLRMGYVRRDE